jgi:hypothetical protein
MHKSKKIFMIFLLLCFWSHIDAIYVNDTFVEHKETMSILTNDPSYLSYLGFVAAGLVGSLYVCYSCLKSSYLLRSFIWKESYFSSDDHSFTNLNAWSLHSLAKLSLQNMKYHVEDFLMELALGYAGTERSHDYHDKLARLNILSRFNLYQFRFFRKIIRTFPEYEIHVTKTIERARCNSSFKAKLEKIQGFESGGLLLFLREEDKRIKGRCEAL